VRSSPRFPSGPFEQCGTPTLAVNEASQELVHLDKRRLHINDIAIRFPGPRGWFSFSNPSNKSIEVSCHGAFQVKGETNGHDSFHLSLDGRRYGPSDVVEYGVPKDGGFYCKVLTETSCNYILAYRVRYHEPGQDWEFRDDGIYKHAIKVNDYANEGPDEETSLSFFVDTFITV
jgi:hypothetical protein